MPSTSAPQGIDASTPGSLPTHHRKKPLASAPLSDYSSTMIPDITLGIVFTFILLGIGTVAFIYLLKGKN